MTATAASGTHPTGMHSCLNLQAQMWAQCMFAGKIGTNEELSYTLSVSGCISISKLNSAEIAVFVSSAVADTVTVPRLEVGVVQ